LLSQLWRIDDNRPRLFFISPHYFFARTIDRYRTGFQLPENFYLFEPALAGNIRLIFQ